MSSWDDYRETCMHGVREGVDSHGCRDCAAIARALGYDMDGGKTWLFRADPRLPVTGSADLKRARAASYAKCAQGNPNRRPADA